MRRLLTFITALGLASGAFAGELAEVSMPDTTQVGDQELVLNGMGLRKKSFIKVYVAGLYLPGKESNAEAILAGDTARRMTMEFKYRVSAKKMCGAWDEGLENNTPDAGADLQSEFETLCSYMDDVRGGDQMVFSYLPGEGTEVTVKGVSKGTIGDKAFADALFACWIGPEPPTADLKKGVLGS